jgi:hypothetical protein
VSVADVYEPWDRLIRIVVLGKVHVGLACRLRGFEGMRLTRLAPEVRFNLSEALSRASNEEEAASPPTPSRGE